jgi:beta-glucosidase-like glycosyl hydrolase/CubicO group peptidase (beta-lactamase class C family)
MNISSRFPTKEFHQLSIFVFVLLLFVTLSCSTSQTATDSDEPDTPPSTIDEPESIITNIDSILVNTDKAPSEKPTTGTEKKTVSVDLDSLLSQMSLREKIGQLFLVPVYGYFQNDSDETYQELVQKIQEYHVGGIMFRSGNIYGQTILRNKLQRLSKIPLWITQDMEYGAAMRVNGATRFVPAMGVAATQNPNYAYWMGKITGREAKTLGVNQIFAPVLDVNNNPKNPVINVRSFSGDPQTVATFGNKFIQGVQSEKIVPTAKHFPGHGDTDIDSHLSLPIINYDFARLDSVELVPFRSAIVDSINSVMSAHISFTKFSPKQNLPATMDSSVINGILRDSLKFKGMIVTDGLDMKGITSNYSPGKAVIEALKAGVDLMLLSTDELTAIYEIEQAVKSGKIAESRINESVRKLLTWKKQHRLFEDNQVNIDSLSSKISRRDHQLIADEISRKSLTLVKNKDDILPIKASEFPKLMVVSVSDGTSGNTGSSFASGIRKYHPDVKSHVLDRRSSKEEKQKMLDDAEKADLIIIGSFIYVRSGQEVQLSEEHLDFLKKLSKDKPSALIAFGNPYVVQDLPDIDVQLMAWSANGGQVKSTVPALFGGSEIDGKLPIEIPGMYPINHGITLPHTTLRHAEPEVAGLIRDSLRKVETIMNQAVFDSTFPGGVVAVVKDGIIAYQKGFGYKTYDKLNPIGDNTIYDLASLTKITATTPAIMKLVDEGRISLDATVGKYVPEFTEGRKSDVTIRNLLLHNSGLPAFRVYIDSLKSESEILNAIKNEPLTYTTGTSYEYSDLGFILLGKIVESVTGQPLDQYLRKEFYYPLGMNSTFYNPQKKGSWISERIPPTEIDTTYRMKTMQAEVHDERAYYLNGVAGHAGLFSSVEDLAIYCQMLLNKGSYADRRYLSPEIVERFTQRQSEQVNRGYGFDRKDDEFSTAGSLTSDKTFGHTGFTGTSYWIDPERNLAIIILTNRTYPHRSYGKNISKVRAAIADAVVSSIIE